ncbi:hypothetical protein V8G54_003913 [Vigna mungo]|uniref:Uncharacterized protein n=1 Tax=Vigna mungo TaxID=3915 RepID=A0AAQ3SES5_VIGMU
MHLEFPYLYHPIQNIYQILPVSLSKFVTQKHYSPNRQPFQLSQLDYFLQNANKSKPKNNKKVVHVYGMQKHFFTVSSDFKSSYMYKLLVLVINVIIFERLIIEKLVY